MSIPYVSAAAACRLLELREERRLSYPSLAVGLALASFVDGRTGVTTIDERTLANRAGVSGRTARDAIRGLSEAGFLVVDARPGMSNLYTVTPARSCRGSDGNPGEKLPDPPARSCRTPRREVAALTDDPALSHGNSGARR